MSSLRPPDEDLKVLIISDDSFPSTSASVGVADKRSCAVVPTDVGAPRFIERPLPRAAGSSVGSVFTQPKEFIRFSGSALTGTEYDADDVDVAFAARIGITVDALERAVEALESESFVGASLASAAAATAAARAANVEAHERVVSTLKMLTELKSAWVRVGKGGVVDGRAALAVVHSAEAKRSAAAAALPQVAPAVIASDSAPSRKRPRDGADNHPGKSGSAGAQASADAADSSSSSSNVRNFFLPRAEALKALRKLLPPPLPSASLEAI